MVIGLLTAIPAVSQEQPAKSQELQELTDYVDDAMRHDSAAARELSKFHDLDLESQERIAELFSDKDLMTEVFLSDPPQRGAMQLSDSPPARVTQAFADGDIEVIYESSAEQTGTNVQSAQSAKDCVVETDRTYRAFGINWAYLRTTLGYQANSQEATSINYSDTSHRSWVPSFVIDNDSVSDWIGADGNAWARATWRGSLVWSGSGVSVSKNQGLAGDQWCRTVYESYYTP